MTICRLCGEDISDGSEVVATLQGVLERESPISHALAVRDELSLEHWECFVREENKGIWAKLWDLLKWQ